MTSPPDALAARALPHLLSLQGARKLVAIAGPPGSGKSAISKALCAALVAHGRGACVVPMDGFHLDNRLLAERGLLPRKGAPETFDAAGFVRLVQRVAKGEDVIFPVFDRERDIAIAGAGHLPPDIEFVLFEGNYLLLRDAPWDVLHRFWDVSIMVDPGQDVLAARLLARWMDANLSEQEARARRDTNDLPNAARTRSNSAPADIVLTA